MQQRAEFKHTKYSARHYLATALMFWDIIEWSEKSTFSISLCLSPMILKLMFLHQKAIWRIKNFSLKREWKAFLGNSKELLGTFHRQHQSFVHNSIFLALLYLLYLLLVFIRTLTNKFSYDTDPYHIYYQNVLIKLYIIFHFYFIYF